MHEIGIVRQIIGTVTEFAKQNDVTDISEVVVDCGELSLVIPKYLQDIYPVVAEGTLLEHAKLVVNVIPGMAECYCPACGSFEKTVLSGRDFGIREIHVPE